jgi:diguanylate cyclase (GGDEF)-like protein
MANELRVLMIEDEPMDAELMEAALKRAGYHFVATRVEAENTLSQALTEFAPNVVLSDYELPGYDGLSALQKVRELAPEIPFIFVSGTIGEERAANSLKQGATDYVLKGNLKRLPDAVARALREHQERLARINAEAEVLRQQQFLRILLDHLADAVVACDAEGKLALCNERAETWHGADALQLSSADRQDEYQLFSEDCKRRLGPEDIPLARAFHGEQVRESPFCIVHEGDEPRHILASGGPILNREGHRLGAVVAMQDITLRRQQQLKIARLARIHAMLGGINSAIVRIRDPTVLFAEVCRIAAGEGAFKLAWIGMVDSATRSLRVAGKHGSDDGYLDSAIAALSDVADSTLPIGQVIRSGNYYVDNDINAYSGSEQLWTEARHRGFASFAAFPLSVDRRNVGTFELYAGESNFFSNDELQLLEQLAADISFALAYEQRDARLKYLAYYDQLTGLANRNLFSERLEQMLRDAPLTTHKLAVLVLDVERFSSINDMFGHSGGDTVLHQIAESLAAVVDQNRLARIGGDRFAVAMPGVKDEAEVLQLFERVITPRLDQSPLSPRTDLSVSLRAGIALSPVDGVAAEALLANAEAALKSAKTSAERYLFYSAEMNTSVRQKLSIEGRLRKAIAERQFVVHYQPKIDIVSAEIVGVEALLRWHDTPSTLVPPGEFMPILEYTGMIVTVGQWVMEQALSDRRLWENMGLRAVRVAVNVSEVQLRRKDFVDRVIAVVNSCGGHEAGLDLEITESHVMNDIDANIARLELLRDCGVNIAIDDFGTGYSSLSYLAKLPVAALKIDKSFVSDMDSDTTNLAIVNSIISLSHSIKLKVIAEGVETVRQRDLLRELKCDEFQGFLFSKPVSAEALGAMLGPLTH